MISTPRETARVDAFVAAIRRSAHCHELCAYPVDPPTVELPAIVATSTPLGASHDEPALVDRLPLWAIVALFVAVFAPAVILFGIDAAPGSPHPAPASHLDTTERVLELGAGHDVR